MKAHRDFGRPDEIIIFFNLHPAYKVISIVYTGKAGWGGEWHVFYEVPESRRKIKV